MDADRLTGLLLGCGCRARCCCGQRQDAEASGSPLSPATPNRLFQQRGRQVYLPLLPEDTPFIPPQPYTRTLPQLVIGPQWLQQAGTAWSYAPDHEGQMRYNRAPLALHDLGVLDQGSGRRLALTYAAAEQIQGLGLDTRIGSVNTVIQERDDPDRIPDVAWTRGWQGIVGMGWAETWTGPDQSEDRTYWNDLRRVRFRAPLPGQGGAWTLADIPDITGLPAIGLGTNRRGFTLHHAGQHVTVHWQGTYSGAGLDRRMDEFDMPEPEEEWRRRECPCTLGGEAVIDTWDGEVFTRQTISLPAASFTCTPFGFRLIEQARDDAGNAYYILPAYMTDSVTSGVALQLRVGPTGAETWIDLPAPPVTRETFTAPVTRLKRLADGGLIIHAPTLGVVSRDATFRAGTVQFEVEGVADGLLQVRAGQVTPALLTELRALIADPTVGLSVTRTTARPLDRSGLTYRAYGPLPRVQQIESTVPATPAPGTVATGRAQDLPVSEDRLGRSGLTLRQATDGAPFGAVRLDLSALPASDRALHFTDVALVPFDTRTPQRIATGLLSDASGRRVLATRGLSFLFDDTAPTPPETP